MTTIVDIKPEELEGLQDAARFNQAERSFVRFLDFVRIMETHQPLMGISGGAAEFQKWPHILEMAKAFEASRKVVVLKARQVGFSWTVAAYVTWLCIFQEGVVALLISQGQDEATDLLDKCRTILRSLPPGWAPKMPTDNRSEITFKDTHSKISALPSTENAGRSGTVTVVVQDEAERHEYLELNYAAVAPTIAAGGQIIMGSSAYKKNTISMFKEFYRESPRNGWFKIFVPWSARPGRDQQWYNNEKAGLSDKLQDMSPDLYMEQEYPGSEQEALAPSKSLRVFEPDDLNQMQPYFKKPKRKVGVGNIYTEWRPGGKYMAGTDCSHGVGLDFAATAIMDARTGYVVADILSNTLGPEETAWESMKLLAEFKYPIWAIEDNDWGNTAIKAAERERYPRLYHRVTGRNTNASKPGWHTDEKSRYDLWGELIEAVRAAEITITNREGLAQFYTIIRNPKRRGRVEAMQGTHDDYPTAVGIAWQMRRFASSPSRGPTTVGARW